MIIISDNTSYEKKKERKMSCLYKKYSEVKKKIMIDLRPKLYNLFNDLFFLIKVFIHS